MKLELRVFIMSILTLITCACSTMQPIDTDIGLHGLKDSIAIGDKIVIYTKPGEHSPGGKNTVVVKSITEEKIIAENSDQNELEFHLKDIEAIEKDRFSMRETARGVGAVALYTLVMLGFATMYLAIGAAM